MEDFIELKGLDLLGLLPCITTLLDADFRVIRQFNAENTPLSQSPGAAFLPNGRSDVSATLQQSRDSGVSSHFETEVIANGESYWFEHDVRRDPEHQVLLAFSKDITVGKKTEEELRQIKRRYEAIFSNVSDAISISTWGTSYDNNELVAVNQRTVELLGYKLEELRTMRPSDILADDYKEAAIKNRKLREAGRLAEVPREFPVKRKDGQIIYIESLGFMIHDEHGQIIEAIAMVRDVTERIEREKQLLQAKLAAEAALTARDVFVANMSEEFQRPVEAIVRHTQFLLDHAELPEPAAAHLHRIRDDAYHLSQQIRDMLDLSRVEAGYDDVEDALIHLPHVFTRLQGNMGVLAQRHHVRLRFELAEDLPVLVQMDEAKFKQIATTLIRAAVKNLPNGEATLQVCVPTEDQLQLKLILIPADDQGVRPVVEESLELSLCRRLVEVMNGRFDLTDSGGRTVIEAELPFVPVRSTFTSSEMPALPSANELSSLPAGWLEPMVRFCAAGQQEQALAHIRLIEKTHSDTAIQMQALLNLFHMSEIGDAIAPLLV
ncbi:MAG: PAS domain S-box protein [Chloroflexi bacterium]|nr:PAS domain S-box protein [Chloroflexota bacterium]